MNAAAPTQRREPPDRDAEKNRRAENLEAQTVTAGGIAELIARPTDNASLVTRIRNWTAQRLLVPLGSVHTGVGKHRQYDLVAVIDAAVLNALAEAGIQPVGREGPLLFALAQTQAAYRDWVRQPKTHYLLEVSGVRSASGEGTAYVHRLRKESERPRPTVDAEVVILVDLNRIFARLPRRLFEAIQGEDKARKGT